MNDRYDDIISGCREIVIIVKMKIKISGQFPSLCRRYCNWGNDSQIEARITGPVRNDSQIRMKPDSQCNQRFALTSERGLSIVLCYGNS